MHLSSELSKNHSEEEFVEDFSTLYKAGCRLIHVRTLEPFRCSVALRKAALGGESTYHEWNVHTGMTEITMPKIYDMPLTEGDHVRLTKAIEKVLTDEYTVSDQENPSYYTFLGPQYWLDSDPDIRHLLQCASSALTSTNKVIIFVTDDAPLPESLAEMFITLRFKTPSIKELSESCRSILSLVDYAIPEGGLPQSDIEKICYAGAGLTLYSFETHLSRALVESLSGGGHDKLDTQDLIQGINKGKTEIVNKNDLLELYPTESMESVAGMDNLKDWVKKRSRCFSDEARDFGIEPPKGMVLVGIPGCGKSLSAKAIARELGVPLIRLDFGRVFNSLVGKSEERIRTALHMVEDMAPCVLFCDEIDKGLGGIGTGGGDSGTSSRVLGTFLTWLQDSTAPVFSMVTANNITALPPELLRRGRFDAIFSVTLPDEAERREVVSIHLRKRGWDPESFDEQDILSVVNASAGYVPAEIESAIKDALVNAFDKSEDLTMDHIVEALAEMVPLSKSHAEAIAAMQAWAENNATPASRKLTGKGRKSVSTKNVRNISRRRSRVKAED